MKMIFAAATAAIAIAAPAAAQDRAQPSDFFNGFYVGGTFGLDATADDDEGGIVFDTNRDGSFDNTVRTIVGSDAFASGSCGGGALGASAKTGCWSLVCSPKPPNPKPAIS